MSAAPMLAGFGSAIADTVCRVSHKELQRLVPGIVAGSVRLVTASEQQRILMQAGQGTPERHPGGSAANTLRAAAAAGCSARMISAVADDADGSFIRRTLEARGVDCSSVITLKNAVTDCVLNLVTPDAERTMLPMIDAGAKITPEHLATEMLENVAHLHFEGYSLRCYPVLKALGMMARGRGIPVSLDLAAVSLIEEYRQELQEFLKLTDPEWIFFNRVEGEAFSGCSDPAAAASFLMEHCRGAVATDGAAGAWCMRRGFTAPVHFPAVPPERLVDTIGAGDTWNGTFLSKLLQGKDICEAGAAASAAASRIIAREGAD